MSQVQDALTRALQASAVAKARYRVFTPEAGHGILVTSIFDAKPIAFRARAVEQYDLGLDYEHDVQVPPTDEPPIVAYWVAYQEEKRAWNQYQAEYISAVYQQLAAGSLQLDTSKVVTSRPTEIRTYEVKPEK